MIIVISVLVITLFLFGCSSEQRVKDKVYLEDKNVSGMKRDEIQQLVENLGYENSINIQKTVDAVLNANRGEKVQLVVEEAQPQLMLNDTKKEETFEIGKAETPLLNKGESRINNIRIASEQLDYMEILPGEEFSFNRELGKRTASKGYEKAPIIVRTENGPKKSFGYGGGICQLSSTLYNAVMESGLEVTERHGHSKSVGYVANGKDATVVYGGADLKFVNTRPNPVVIRTFLNENSLTVKISEKQY